MRAPVLAVGDGALGHPVRLGQIKAAEDSWVFLLFLTEDGSRLIACTGVRRTHA